MDCPICYERLDDTEALSCGHAAHKQCVDKATSAMQEYLYDQGYPPIKNGKCPICRTILPEISAKRISWSGTVELNTDQCMFMVDFLMMQYPYVPEEHIPNFITEQMGNADTAERIYMVNNIITYLWLLNKSPQTIAVTKTVGGLYKYRTI